jgi:hypothetical protein
VGDTTTLLREFWRESADERRAALLPFLWGTIAKAGQILGNPAKRSVGTVTNGLNFSYPGYNEMILGAADSRINSNSYGPNPNVTVFEWLNGKAAYKGKVAVLATWGAFRDEVASMYVPVGHLRFRHRAEIGRRSSTSYSVPRLACGPTTRSMR